LIYTFALQKAEAVVWEPEALNNPYLHWELIYSNDTTAYDTGGGFELISNNVGNVEEHFMLSNVFNITGCVKALKATFDMRVDSKAAQEYIFLEFTDEVGDEIGVCTSYFNSTHYEIGVRLNGYNGIYWTGRLKLGEWYSIRYYGGVNVTASDTVFWGNVTVYQYGYVENPDYKLWAVKDAHGGLTGKNFTGTVSARLWSEGVDRPVYLKNLKVYRVVGKSILNVKSSIPEVSISVNNLYYTANQSVVLLPGTYTISADITRSVNETVYYFIYWLIEASPAVKEYSTTITLTINESQTVTATAVYTPARYRRPVEEEEAIPAPRIKKCFLLTYLILLTSLIFIALILKRYRCLWLISVPLVVFAVVLMKLLPCPPLDIYAIPALLMLAMIAVAYKIWKG
jgi:hypothetical protein